MKNQIYISDEKYKFDSELFLLRNGRLLRKKYNEEKNLWEQYVINSHSRYMEAAAGMTVSFQKGLVLKTFLSLFEPYISMYNTICSGWLKPLFKEYKKDMERGVKKITNIRYLEVYKTADFSLYQLSAKDRTKLEADFDIYPGFHGVGRKSKNEKENTPYSLSLSSIASIDSIPLRINNKLPGGIILTHYPYHSGKIRFRKTRDGMYEYISDNKNRNHRYSYDLRELLSAELSREYKEKIRFPEIKVTFTLGEALNAIVDDMTFYGLGKERERVVRELEESHREAKKIYK